MPSPSLLARISLSLLLLFMVRPPVQAAAETNWPVLNFTPVASGLDSVVDIQNAADGSNRLFLVQQKGQIRIMKSGALLPAPLLDLNGKIAPYGEQGLLGLAIPPGFAQKKCFYVYYCRLSDGATVLSRFKMSSDPNVADSKSETILMINPKTATNHNGGQLAFGPEGYLYISVGDGGGQGDPNHNSQNLTKRFGKILRIDVDHVSTALGLPYAIPASNPFATSPSSAKEILCWGLRNPWRFSFDPLTGDMFIGDVGENSREEIDFIPAASINAGNNFGWSVKEGTLDFTAQSGTTGTLRPPVFEYDHDLGSSMTGGHIYRGADPHLQGFYLFGDFDTGRMWAMENSAAKEVAMLKETDYSFSTFGKDEAGEIYFSDYYGGTVYRIGTLDTLPAPVISPAAGIFNGKVPFTINTDVPGAIVRYTTDGSTPGQDSPVFPPGAPMEKFDPFTLKAASFRADLNPSPVAEATYQLRPSVEIGGGRGQLNDYTSILVTTTASGAEIHYTLDGSDPTKASPLYTGSAGVFISRSLVLKAIAFKEGDGWLPGVVSGKAFTLTVASPDFSQQFYDLYDSVDVISKTQGAKLHYTMDGSPPTLASPLWSAPQDLPGGTKIWVLAEKGEMGTSNLNLEVSKISAQKVRFEKIGTGSIERLNDVVCVNPTTILAVGYYSIYQLSGTDWTPVPSFYASYGFKSGCIAANGNLSLVDSISSEIIQCSLPSFGSPSHWAGAPAYLSHIVALPTGGFLFADGKNRRIQKITGSSVITPVAGTGTAGSADGPAALATFNTPTGIARDAAGNIYVSEYNGRIRKIGMDNVVTTVAGSGVQDWIDGPSAAARFSAPQSIAVDRIGNLYVADHSGKSPYPYNIRKIRPDGTVTTLYGNIVQPDTDTVVSPGSFGVSAMVGLDVDSNGVIYMAGKLSDSDSILKATQEDWDNDGIPDAVEVALGAPFVVGVDDRLADADGDHYSNCAEWIAGTNPLVATSQPTERKQIQFKDGTIALNLPCEPGKTNQLEYSDDLQNWKPMGVPSASAFRSFATRFSAPQFTGQRFYRLRSIP